MASHVGGNRAVAALTGEEEGGCAFVRFRRNGDPRWPKVAQVSLGRSEGHGEELS
jgi:hypothetical protein